MMHNSSGRHLPSALCKHPRVRYGAARRTRPSTTVAASPSSTAGQGSTQRHTLFLNPETFTQRVEKQFNARTTYEDQNTFHPQLAQALVQFAQLPQGASVLDVATGTGLVAFLAARAVGPTGRVLGVDLSEGMLAQAAVKQQQVGATSEPQLAPIEFMRADIEALTFPTPGSFDAIISSAFVPFLADLPRALRTWRSWLRPGGLLAFNSFPDPQNPEYGLYIELAQQRYGLLIEDCNARLGTPARCVAAMEAAGFERVSVEQDCTVQRFRRTPAEYVASIWRACLTNPFYPLTDALDVGQLADFEAAFAEAAVPRVGPRFRDGEVQNPVTVYKVKGFRP